MAITEYPRSSTAFEADYLGSIQYAFDMDGLLQYLKFHDVLAERTGLKPS